MASKLISTRREAERVFLVGLQTGTMKRAEAEASLAELHRLAHATRDSEVVGDGFAHVRTPDPATFISKGLVEDLGIAIRAAEAGTAILDDDITPAQQNNLETRWGVKLLNRSELILDIFAGRAHTADGKLQVELAQLQYRLPRLRGLGVRLSRLGGGIGSRGPGEKMLETDRRALEARIHALDERIGRLKRQRATQRARRRAVPVPTLALAGYTNAGKSTLLNALTGADAFVEDKLFATLGTTTRGTTFPSGQRVVITDTVGFINRLPTQLVAAFRATLEEVLYADLIVHVVDATSPAHDREMQVTREVLRDLGAGATPVLTVWNKIDALNEGDPEPGFFERQSPPAVAISALRGIGLDRLLNEAQRLLDAARPQVWLKFSYKEYREVARLESGATVHKLLHREEGIYALASLTEEQLGRYGDRIEAKPPAEEELDGAE